MEYFKSGFLFVFNIGLFFVGIVAACWILSLLLTAIGVVADHYAD